jgi:serine/threonine protein kinase
MDLAGKTLADRYRITGHLGRGGMADVYRGEDTLLNRTVAIKVLSDRTEDVRKRFLREAQAMAQLNHHNIVAVYDVGDADGISYIVMELLEGRTLREIPSTELTMHKAVRFFVQLLDALQYAHERDVIHRDIKPANIMVLPDGTVKVMDFGLSRRTTEMSSVTSAGEIVGTIAYLSPERFLGKNADARSDLYSVGVVMYEVFTDTVPFKSDVEDLVAVIFAHVNDLPVLPRSINRNIPLPVERIIMQLLEKDPERRPDTALAVANELRALISPDAPQIPGRRPPPVPPQAQPQAPPPGASAAAARPPRPAPSKAENAAREVLEKTFGSTATLNEGYANVLAGMLAARKGDFSEASRAYKLSLAAFQEVKNELEYAKTALKYGVMVLQKSSDPASTDRRDVEFAIETLTAAMPELRGRRMSKELDESERILYALQKIGVRYH